MYIRTKEKIIEVNPVITNEKTEKKVMDSLMEYYAGVKYSEDLISLCDEFIRIEKDGTRSPIDKRLLDLGKKIAIEFKLEMYGCIWTNDGLYFAIKLNKNGDFVIRGKNDVEKIN